MITYLSKLMMSAGIIVVVSELGKRVSWLAALVASLPLISIISITWVYVETKDAPKVIDLRPGILWAILPSLTFFIVLPVCLRNNISFPLSMIISIAVMFIGYLLYVAFMRQIGITV